MKIRSDGGNVRKGILEPLVAFLVAIAFWPGISGAATSPRWAIAAVSLWFMDWRVLPFISVCSAVLSFDAACHWTIISAAFCWGLNGRPDYRLVTRAFALGIAVSGLVAIAQLLGWSGISQVAIPGGLFLNKNFMGEAACLALIACASLRLIPETIILMPALLFSTSRASWIAAIFGLFLLLPSWRLRLLLLSAALCLAVLLWSGGLLSEATLLQRFTLWHDASSQLTWFGNGTYERMFSFGRAEQLHNDWLQLIYELGIIGFVPLIVILAAINAQSAPFIAALLIIGSFGFPLHLPATAWFAAFIVGSYLGRSNAGQRIPLREGPVVHHTRAAWPVSRLGV